jgi:NAD(P)-dependent dehydrogenase (short-subunit alcohol dehydrogenase family)
MPETEAPVEPSVWRRPDRRVAIITGAGSGAGAAIAMAFASRGVRVLVSDVDYVLAGDVASLIRAQGGMAVAHRCDVSSDEQVASLFDRAEHEFGALDFVVNNAGPRLVDESPVHWPRILDVNLQGTLRVTARAVDRMQERGGSIVNVASAQGLGFRADDQPVYAAAKAGVLRFTSGLGGLRQSSGIRVNAIAPDRIDSPESFAEVVFALAVRESLGGRVVLYTAGSEPALVPDDEPGIGPCEAF